MMAALDKERLYFCVVRRKNIMTAYIKFKEINTSLAVGDIVEKYTGDYQLQGEIRAIFVTKLGKTRFVVEHAPGFLHIYSENNIRKIS